jgi:hypothetical protein
MRCLSIVFVTCVLGWRVAATAAQGESTMPIDAGGAVFDAAPFGDPLSDSTGSSIGVRWTEARKIRRVMLVLPDGAAAPPSVRVEFWHCEWDGRADVPPAERDAAGAGWEYADDWFNGEWRTAKSQVQTVGGGLELTFQPTSPAESDKFKAPGVTYRRTTQVRVAAAAPFPPGTRLHTFTDAVLKPLRVRIGFGIPRAFEDEGLGPKEGVVEVHNGHLGRLNGVDHATADANGVHWSLRDPRQGVLEADLLYAADPFDPHYDRTVVTVRSSIRPFSFFADDVARGDRVLVDDLGVLVTRADDPITLAEYRAQLRELGRKTVYDRVQDEPEQTLMRAWNDMPLKRPLYFVHGLPGNRNSMRQYPNGDILVSSNPHWFTKPPSTRDTPHKRWHGDWIRYGFGLSPDPMPGGRALRDGYLPILRTWWQEGPLYIEQATVLAPDDDPDALRLDTPTVMYVSVRFVNTSDCEPATARLRLTSVAHDVPEELRLDGDVVWAEYEGAVRPRYMLSVSTADETSGFTPDGNALRWERSIPPRESARFAAWIPSITVEHEELARISGCSFDAAADQMAAYWQRLTEAGTQVNTPEPWLNNFYRSHARHLLVNCLQELDSDRLHAHVGTFYYGVFPNESVMMISDLDRRGLHDFARRCYDSFLHYQGTVAFPGAYGSKEGLFYGAGGHEMGGYNKSHGYVLWGLAEHWRLTRDRAWMQRAAPSIAAGCDWILRERQRTMTAGPGGTRPLEFGWLPKGSLEDVTDYWYWLATNAATAWGFLAAADALADFGHPRGVELRDAAAAYRDDVVRGIQEARIRAGVVRLRDGTYVPKFPSHLHLRGRAVGWIRETLEGSLFLPAYQLIDPRGRETSWILKDYEDNLYISDTYGYSIPAFESFWFSRGGFSMQSNLLDGPLPYLWRDEIKHYLRAFFNGFASAYYPDIAMCNEHCLPELGYPMGDHFKSSDEAQVAYWLRLMFIREDGEDLVLGQALPRDWLRDGEVCGIERAPTHFGPMGLRIASHAAESYIDVTLTPPDRNPPRRIFVRLRHPESSPLKSVIVNGAPHSDFDPQMEWIVLPGSLTGPQEILARY